jgi:hypothetical protein
MLIARAVRGALGRVCALALGGLILAIAIAGALVPSSASGAADAPSTTPSPTYTRGLALNVNLLGVRVGVDVPLSLGGVLGISHGTTPSTPPPSTPPPSTPPPSTPTPPPPPSSSHSTATHSTQPATTTAVPPPAGGGGGIPPASSSSSAAPRSTAPRTRSTAVTPSTSAHTSARPGGIELSNRVLRGNDTLVLVSVLAGTAVAVALFVRISGRRGGHQT